MLTAWFCYKKVKRAEDEEDAESTDESVADYKRLARRVRELEKENLERVREIIDLRELVEEKL